MALGRSVYQLAFQISPIILTGGIAANVPGGGIPIVLLTQGLSFVNGLLSGGDNLTNPDNYFASFMPMPGASLIDNDIATFPFANQAIAANAIIAKPLVISLKMICPMRNPGDAVMKLATMTALKLALDSHNTSGGTYTIATPTYLYTNCLLTGMKDITGGESKQIQYEWQLDFAQPLLTQSAAAAAQNSLMNAISNGLGVSGDPPAATGLASAVGFPPSLAMPSVVPSAVGLPGAGVAGTSAASFGFPGNVESIML